VLVFLAHDVAKRAVMIRAVFIGCELTVLL
jgi:hypothetical protein